MQSNTSADTFVEVASCASQNSLKLRESSLLNSRKVCQCRQTHTHTVTHNITTHYTERVTGDRVKTKYGMITEAQATPVVYMVLCLLSLLVCVCVIFLFCLSSPSLTARWLFNLTSHTNHPVNTTTHRHCDAQKRKHKWMDVRGVTTRRRHSETVCFCFPSYVGT